MSTVFGVAADKVRVYKLHGNIAHHDRLATIRAFAKDDAHAVLLCTDVAARGLDLPNITNVLQYEPPSDIKDYIHRLGRSARIGHSGEGLLWLLPSEVEYLARLKAVGATLQS